MSDALLLQVLFSHVSHSEFLLLMLNIPGMIVSEKKCKSKESDAFWNVQYQ
jgi:hypothetical protein